MLRFFCGVVIPGKSLLLSRAFQRSYFAEPMDLSSSGTTFRAKDLEIHPTNNPKPLPQFSPHIIPFGAKSSDHMLTIDWSKKDGWGKPVISEMKPITMHRFNSSLHYAIQGFEGLKAYKNENGEIRIFRPDCNMLRFKNTSKALCLPDFDGNQLIECIKKLVKLDERWIPAKRGFSMYLRPTHISMENTLGVKDASASQLYVVTGPTGTYFTSGFNPVALYCETEKIRSAPKGYGSYKMGSNYGPTLLSSKNAQAQGYSQCIWLYEGRIVEVGASNIFFVKKHKDGTRELLTPQLDGLVLPGVIRDSLIRLGQKKNGLKVTERRIMIDEVIEGLENGTMREIFGAGTGVIVSPVKAIGYKGKHYPVPYDEKLQAGELTHELFNEILDIQQGKGRHPWIVPIN